MPVEVLDGILHDASTGRRRRGGLARRQRRHLHPVRQLGEIRQLGLRLLRGLRRCGRALLLCLALPAIFLGLRLNALGRVAARVRQRIGRLWRLFGRARDAILIREITAQGRPLRPHVEARLHEHEPRRLLEALLREQKSARASGARRIRKKSRRDEHDDDREQVKDECDEDALARGNRAADGRELRTIVLEIEIHQEVT